jgi:hypothetical protein
MIKMVTPSFFKLTCSLYENILISQLSENRGLPASGCDSPYLRHQGRSRSPLLRALYNKGDGVSSAFPKSKQNNETNI